ncbi:hypothetical protein CY34DRAFT_236299 [Suillus luteus UH-Slu-Lm8-n1]|uniref:Uncharacterized protein n=1 Tax=Suillus luteus UH-Slu-Lm8-n1 TaxID=930992 RepID=A0A0D0B3I1_9AGAM|nr:hypothetical protein CY34DRAFT_236299 [Suillus luteus UH-Slu-Lm8-n1]
MVHYYFMIFVYSTQFQSHYLATSNTEYTLHTILAYSKWNEAFDFPCHFLLFNGLYTPLVSFHSILLF